MIMDKKQNAAGGKPAATSGKRDTVRARAHHTTKIPRLDIDALLSKVNLEEIAERAGTKLHRNGGDLRGICPLHKGDNATAFSVYADPNGHQRWRCYTQCDASGDVIDFVRRWQGLDFMDAVK